MSNILLSIHVIIFLFLWTITFWLFTILFNSKNLMYCFLTSFESGNPIIYTISFAIVGWLIKAYRGMIAMKRPSQKKEKLPFKIFFSTFPITFDLSPFFERTLVLIPIMISADKTNKSTQQNQCISFK